MKSLSDPEYHIPLFASIQIKQKLVRAACMRCHGTKCPLLMALCNITPMNCNITPMNTNITPMNEVVTFLPEGVIVGFRNFAWGFKSQKNKIWG